jgi:hypothetical protein
VPVLAVLLVVKNNIATGRASIIRESEWRKCLSLQSCLCSLLAVATGRASIIRESEWRKCLPLQFVPQLGSLQLDHSVDALVAFSEGASMLNPKVQREGVVLRPVAEEYDEDIGGRLSFKVINPKFLLKYEE